MQRIANVMLSRLVHNVRGMALVEFALCLPVLLLLYLGGYAVSDLISCNRKVATATRSLVDIVSRTMSPTIIYNAPQNADATSYLSASAVVLAPYNLSRATEQISLLRVCDATHAYVVWTQAQTQNTDGSIVTAVASNETAGTLPANQTQLGSNIVTIPSNMVTSSMIPVSADGSDICLNLDPMTATNKKTQVGTAGGWLLRSQVNYQYTPPVTYHSIGTATLTDTIYMAPRLY
jgi:Flp pilus assembly protein TadG